MKKFEEEFRLGHPETKDETDKEFDNANYTEWLEKKLSNSNTEIVKIIDEMWDNIISIIGESEYVDRKERAIKALKELKKILASNEKK